MVFKNTVNQWKNNATKKPFVTIDCEPKEKMNLDYADLVSPLNEKQVCSSLDFFSAKAPKKKSNLKKVPADDLKNKRRRLENLFSTVDLDDWSESNFVLPNTKSENWHDDLHYIVLRQQERSNLIHQLWMFFMLLLLCILLISIAGLIYSKNGVYRHVDESDSYEFMQKFIDDFNHTEQQHKQTNSLNKYLYNMLSNNDDESNKIGWLKQKANYVRAFIDNAEDQVLNLTKRMARSVNDAQTIDNLNEVDYDLIADESTSMQQISDRMENSVEEIVKRTNLNEFLKKVKGMF